MPENPLFKKLKLKPNQRAGIINAPDGYFGGLGPLPEGAELSEKLRGKFDWLQVFVRSKAELEKLAPRIDKALNPGGLVWITFPKGTSRSQTDLTRDNGWEAIAQTNLKWINLVSIDATWSAFSLRPYREGEPRQTFR